MRDHSAHITLTREQAIDALLTHMRAASATELVGVRNAWGRVCATDCRATTDVPNATCAQMDGIAVRFADFSDGMPDTSLWKLGRDFAWANTGTAIPAGFDSVIPIEEVRFPKAPTLDEKNPGSPLLDAAPRTAGAFCRQRGCDFAFGDVVVHAHSLLTPDKVALLAMCGLSEVEVVRGLLQGRARLHHGGPRPHGAGLLSRDKPRPRQAHERSRDRGHAGAWPLRSARRFWDNRRLVPQAPC